MLFVTVLSALFVVAPTIAEPATKTPFTAEASFVPGNISLGKVWITKGNVQHVMGAESDGTVTGDISGTMWLVSYETVNLETGDGVNHGKFVLTVDEGAFEGSFRSVVTPDGFSGTFVGHSTGMYKEQKMLGSYEGELTIVDAVPVVEMVLEGIILSPKG